MLAILASGTLVRDPTERVSANGKRYATANLRVPCEGDESVLLSVIAFNEHAVQALLALNKGDTLSVTGRGKLSAWEQAGEHKHGVSVVAEAVLTAYQIEKRRARAQGVADDDDRETASARPPFRESSHR